MAVDDDNANNDEARGMNSDCPELRVQILDSLDMLQKWDLSLSEELVGHRCGDY